MPQAARIENALPKPLGAPLNWVEERDGHCNGLFIRIEEMGGVQFMRSAWDVEPTEALKMLSGARLILSVSGNRHPVVDMDVAPLPEDFPPAYSVRRIMSASGVQLARVEGLFAHEGTARMVYCEESLAEGGLSLAVGRAIDKIEALVCEQGWNA